MKGWFGELWHLLPSLLAKVQSLSPHGRSTELTLERFHLAERVSQAMHGSISCQ